VNALEADDDSMFLLYPYQTYSSPASVWHARTMKTVNPSSPWLQMSRNQAASQFIPVTGTVIPRLN
jgi:hypothetical protein